VRTLRLSPTNSTHTGCCHLHHSVPNMRSMKQHANSIILTIIKMPNFQSGAKYKVAPEHHGHHAHQNDIFLTCKRCQQEELLGSGRSTRFQTSQVNELTMPTIEVIWILQFKKLLVYAVMEAIRLATPCRMLQFNQFFFCRCTRGQQIWNPVLSTRTSNTHKGFISPSKLKIEKNQLSVVQDNS
jgi:hypothetical protein